MPLTLEQTNLLIAVLGIKVPPAILEQKALEEKFRKREADVGARGEEMKQRSDGAKLQALFTQAGTAAKGKDFTGGLKLLDQVEAGLALPDPAEEFRKRAAEIEARSGEMAQRSDGATLKVLSDQAATEAAGNDFAAAMKLFDQVEAGLNAPDVPPPPPPTPASLPVWRDAKDAVDAQCGQLYDQLKRVGLPVLMEAANQIENVLGGYRTKLVVALTNYDGAAGDAKEKARTAALNIVSAYQDTIPNDSHVIAADTNPFGVQVTIRATLGAALDRLRQQLSSN